MTSKTWSAVDDYIVEKLIPVDPALEAALANNARQGLPAIDVSAAQGKLLNILARMSAPGASSRSERLAAIRRSGWPARSKRAARW